MRDALASASFGPHLSACAFRMLDAFDENVWAEAVLILDRQQWDSEASAACEAARIEAGRVLEAVSVQVILICRTTSEHAEFASRENGIWTSINPNVSC